MVAAMWSAFKLPHMGDTAISKVSEAPIASGGDMADKSSPGNENDPHDLVRFINEASHAWSGRPLSDAACGLVGFTFCVGGRY